MLRQLLAIILSVQIAGLDAAVVQPQQPPLTIPEFYLSLIEAIDTIQAHIVFELKAGAWRTTVGGNTADWTMFANETMTADVEYRDGVLAKAQATFDPAINIRVPPGIALALRRIEYNEAGVPTRITTSTGTDVPNPPPMLIDQLRFAHEPRALFLGAPIAAVQPSDVVADATFVARLRLLKASADRPGFRVTFKDRAQIKLTSTVVSELPSYLVVTTPSVVDFSEVTLDFVARTVNGRLERFDATVDDGFIASGGMALRFTGPSAMTASMIDFAFPGAGPQIRMTSGTMRAAVGLGSTILLAQHPVTPTVVTAASGSSVLLRDVSFDIGTQNVLTVKDGQLAFRVADARMPVGDAGYLLLREGEIAATVSGVWKTGSAPQVRTDFRLVATELYAGSLLLGRELPARIRGGTARSTTLSLDTSKGPLPTGTLSALAAELENGSVLDVSDHMRIGVAVGARLTADDVADPLTIAGSGRVTGRMDLFAPFAQARVEDTATVRDGYASGTLRILADGNVDASNVNIRGRAAITATLAPGVHKTFRADVALENGSWGHQGGQIVSQYDVDFSMAPPGLIDVQQPDHPMDFIAHDRALRTRITLFPVRFSLDFYRDISLPRFTLKRLGDVYQVAPGNQVTAVSRVKLSIPARLPPDYGDDDRQELLRARCFARGFPFGQSTDLQLVPAEYDAPLRVSVTIVNGKPTIVVRPDIPRLATDLDLCDGDVAAAVLFGVAVSAFTGGLASFIGFGTPVFWGLVGLTFGAAADANSLAAGYVNALIQNMLSNKSFVFTP